MASSGTATVPAERAGLVAGRSAGPGRRRRRRARHRSRRRPAAARLASPGLAAATRSRGRTPPRGGGERARPLSQSLRTPTRPMTVSASSLLRSAPHQALRPCSSPVSGSVSVASGHESHGDDRDRRDGARTGAKGERERQREKRQRGHEEARPRRLAAPREVVGGVVRRGTRAGRCADEGLGTPPARQRSGSPTSAARASGATTSSPFSETRSESAARGSGSPTP